MGAAGERVMRDLRRDIITGVLAAGSRLTEASLVDRYGTSRVPVREALRSLAADGLIELRPNAGAKVADLPEDDLDDLFAVRTTVESITARRCARRVAAEGAGEVVESLRAILREGWQALDEGREADVAVANTRFHLTLARLSGATSMETVLNRVAERIQWAYASTVPRQGARSWTEHGLLVDAIAAGDSDEAVRVMAAHIDASRSGFRHRQDRAGAPVTG